MNQTTSTLEQTQRAIDSLRDLRKQQVAIDQQVTQAEDDLHEQLAESLEWVRAILTQIINSNKRHMRVTVWQRIRDGQIFERDMLEPLVGFWLAPVENGQGILVCSPAHFVELDDIKQEADHPSYFDAEISANHELLIATASEWHAAHILQAVATLQRAAS